MGLAVLGVALLTLAVAGGASGTSSGPTAAAAKVVPDELIVGFKKKVPESERGKAVADAGASEKKRFDRIRVKVIKVEPAKLDKVLKKLSADPRVAYVERNFVVQADATPNDPEFAKLWGLHNTGQTVNGTAGTADADIDAPAAWDVTTGSTAVTVAVIDTGVDFSHPDLGGSQTASPLMWINPGENCTGCRTNGVDDDGNGYKDDYRGWDFVNSDNNPFDDDNHGTHVSGTIGALGNNGTGVAGVNWTTKIMALKFLDANGSGTNADAIEAILYAADKGADVLNNSWGGVGYSQAVRDAIAVADQAGGLFVAAAGNSGTNNDSIGFFPASYDVPNVVSVAATDSNDKLATFSNYGATSVDLGAPGVSIYSTIPGGTYAFFSGTSMGTPHVAGAAALLGAAFPGASDLGLKALLLGTTDLLAALAGKVATGGRLNLGTAAGCSGTPELVAEAPVSGFVVAVGAALALKVIGTSCALTAGVTVEATVNGVPVTLTARGDGLYTGSFTPTAAGPLAVTYSVGVGGTTVTQTVNGTAQDNYRYEDAAYAWVDASAGGTKANLAVDDGSVTVNLPFSFSFYDDSFTSVKISTNGYLVFGTDSATAYLNTPFPTPATPNRVVAPYWDDLNPAKGGSIWYQTVGSAPNRRFVVAWIGVPHYSTTGTATFEAILEEATGDIYFQYQDVHFGSAFYDLGASASVGVENATGTLGSQFLYGQALLAAYENATALRFSKGPPGPPPPPDTTPPAAPTGLTATGGNGTVALDWANNTEPDLAGYRVYRQNPDTTWSLIASPVASAYTDSGRTNGTTYTYRVAAYDGAAPANESAPSLEASATPLALPVVKNYVPAGYTILAGTIVVGHGAVSRLYTNDGVRLLLQAALSAGTYVADYYAYTTIAASELATLRKITISYDGNASTNKPMITLRVYNWSTGLWETVDGPRQATTGDRLFGWTVSALPARYASPAGAIRFEVRGTASSAFTLRTDKIGFTIEY